MRPAARLLTLVIALSPVTPAARADDGRLAGALKPFVDRGTLAGAVVMVAGPDGAPARVSTNVRRGLPDDSRAARGGASDGARSRVVSAGRWFPEAAAVRPRRDLAPPSTRLKEAGRSVGIPARPSHPRSLTACARPPAS